MAVQMVKVTAGHEQQLKIWGVLMSCPHSLALQAQEVIVVGADQWCELRTCCKTQIPKITSLVLKLQSGSSKLLNGSVLDSSKHLFFLDNT